STSERAARESRASRRGFNWAFLGVLPFFLFIFAFLLFPIGFLIVGSFPTGPTNAFTLQNYADLTNQQVTRAFANSIEISFVTAVAGALFGLLLAYSIILGGLPKFLRTFVMTFSGVASNFAGIPLALAFLFTLGNAGLVTVWLQSTFHISLINDLNFRILSKIGLEIVYFYFQLPLMVLIIAPAIDGLRKEWRGAAGKRGAGPRQHWRCVTPP